ncbi:MAG TPA: type II toxin-antitoxin system VapC family toxin [Candidatus Dormibacteraeota bacterium]|jgi:predicted nucleic acid-binding protein
MATLVVDANVIVQACIEEAGLGPLAGHNLVAPPIGPSEALSALHELRYRGEISSELAAAALIRLQSYRYAVRAPHNVAQTAWAISEALGWAKTYDSEYVALAQILKCPVVTLDARLRRGAGRLVRIIGPADVQPLPGDRADPTEALIVTRGPDPNFR